MTTRSVGRHRRSGRTGISPFDRAASHTTVSLEPQTLRVRGLEKRFGGTQVLHGLDIDVAPGQVVGLVGPNGCGKSTTIRCVTGLVKPDGGEILVSGIQAGSSAARARASLIPDHASGFEELTIEEFLTVYCSLYGYPDGYADRQETLLRSFNLSGRRRSYLRALSTGMRREVSMVAALSVGADLVVVDEAAATLDPEAVIVLREALSALSKNKGSVLLATQDLNFAEQTCSFFFFLHQGKIVRSGTHHEIIGVESQRQRRAVSLEDIFLASVGQGAMISELRRDLARL